MDRSLRDLFGRELELGRIIAYPGLMGRSAIMKLGMIRALNPGAMPGRMRVGIYTSSGNKASLTYSKRVIMLDDRELLSPEAASSPYLNALAKRFWGLRQSIPGACVPLLSLPPSEGVPLVISTAKGCDMVDTEERR